MNTSKLKWKKQKKYKIFFNFMVLSGFMPNQNYFSSFFQIQKVQPTLCIISFLIQIFADKIITLLILMINLDNLNPDWQFASRHGKASLVGEIKLAKNSNNNQNEICPCCFQFIYKQPVSLIVNSKELEFLGFGFPLFYSFLKNCIILLIILICSYNAIALKKAIDGNYQFCHINQMHPHRLLAGTESQLVCTSFMVQLARIQANVSSQEKILRIASFIVQMFFLIYMRDHITKLQAYYDQRNTSLSDYSIILKNIPKQKNIQLKLKQFFVNAFKRPHQIQQITLIPQYEQIDELKKQKSQIIEKLKQAYKKLEFQQDDMKQLQNLQKVDKAISEQIFQSEKNFYKDQLQTQKVILVFNTDEQKIEIIHQFNQMGILQKGPYFGIGSEQIVIREAPQPLQIFWNNINLQKNRKIILFLISWSLSILVLSIVTIIFYFILNEKSIKLEVSVKQVDEDPKNQIYQQHYNQSVVLVYFLLILVVLFNKLVMSKLFYKFTQIQRNQTRSKFQFSFCIKYLLGLFFTTALMTLAVQAITYHNYYSHSYGVIEEQTIMFFLNALFTPIFWLINPFQIFKTIKRCLFKGKKYFTQQEANQLMQQSHYDMGKRYAQVIQTLWFTFLYATLIPIGAFISLGGIIIYYWVDKFTLLRRSSLGGQVSGRIVIKAMKLVDLTLFLKPVGQLLFDIQVHHENIPVQSIVMLLIGFLYFILPTGKLINIINPQMFHPEEKTYQDAKEQFKNTYHSEHPIIKILHAERMRKTMGKKGYILSKQSRLNATENNLIQGLDSQFSMPYNYQLNTPMKINTSGKKNAVTPQKSFDCCLEVKENN